MFLQNINTSMENLTSQTEAGNTEELHERDRSRSHQESGPVEEKVYVFFFLFFFFNFLLYMQFINKLTLPCSIQEMLLILIICF